MQKMKSAKMIRRPRHKPHDILYIYIYKRRHGIVMKIPHAKWDLYHMQNGTFQLVNGICKDHFQLGTEEWHTAVQPLVTNNLLTSRTIQI